MLINNGVFLAELWVTLGCRVEDCVNAKACLYIIFWCYNGRAAFLKQEHPPRIKGRWVNNRLRDIADIKKPRPEARLTRPFKSLGLNQIRCAYITRKIILRAAVMEFHCPPDSLAQGITNHRLNQDHRVLAPRQRGPLAWVKSGGRKYCSSWRAHLEFPPAPQSITQQRLQDH
jgi:hypothetical protein